MTALPMRDLVFCLAPEPKLFDEIQRRKELTLRLVGPQTYLDHPPHVTLYVARFPADAVSEELIKQCCAAWTACEIELAGWHVFDADALTGARTVVCRIAGPSVDALRSRQQEVVRSFAPLRDVVGSTSRYAPALAALGEAERNSVHQFGFPYLSEGWVPHITIASIRPADFDIAWANLAQDSLFGRFSLSVLHVDVLDRQDMERWISIPLPPAV